MDGRMCMDLTFPLKLHTKISSRLVVNFPNGPTLESLTFFKTLFGMFLTSLSHFSDQKSS